MDPHGLVLSQGETASPRGAAPAHGEYLAAHAYQNSSPSRILRLDCTPGDEIEDHCRRVFPDPAGQNHHCSAARDVRLGETIPQGGERRRTPSRIRFGCKAVNGTWQLKTKGAKDESDSDHCSNCRSAPAGLGTRMFLIALARTNWQAKTVPGGDRAYAGTQHPKGRI
jgi:hypothetical protein